MMLHSRQALGRHLLRPSVISSTRLSVAPSLSQISHYQSTAVNGRNKKDIFPANSAMIDEPVDQIHKRMVKLTHDFRNKDKLDKYTKTFLESPSKEPVPVVADKPANADLFVGHVVEFAHRDSFEIGFASSSNGKSITVTTIDNQQVKIHASQVINVWPGEVGKVSLEELKSIHAKLPEFLESQPIRKRDITEAWKKLNIFVKVPYTSTLMSKILFNSTSPIAVYASFKMMAASPYFRRWDQKNTGYKIFNSEGLKGTRMAQFINKIQQKLAGVESGSALLPNWDVLVDGVFRDDLITFANNGTAAPAKSTATAKFVLQGLKLDYTPEAAATLLQKIGVPVSVEQRVSDPLSVEARAQSERIAAFVKQQGGKFSNVESSKKSKKSKASISEFPDVDLETREDLTHHVVVAVDTDAFAADTGVSMKVSEDGSKATIYLHAADPTRWVKTTDAISLQAQDSANTLYMPQATHHMLPKSFLESTALSSERENYSLTLALHVNPTTGTLQNYEVFPSITNKVIQSTYKMADKMMKGEAKEGEKGFDKVTLNHVSSLLQNLQMLKEARMENAPYEEPSIPLYEPDMRSNTGISPARHASVSFSALHYVTLLADEAIAKFADAHELPLPSPPNFTRPLRNFAGMVTHWQIKAALRKDELPYSNAEMESIRSWLWKKSSKNNEEVSKLRDQATQSALRSFFNRQRAVIGNRDVLLTAQVVKTSPANRTVTINLRELRYKSVMTLSEANFARVEAGSNIVVRLRERPTHIGMAFVDVEAKTESLKEENKAPKIATRDLKEPRNLNLGESFSATLSSVVQKAATSRTSAVNVPFMGSRVQTVLTGSSSARPSVRYYSTDNNNNSIIPPGMKIAKAQVGNKGDDFSDSAAPHEPYWYDLDPEDLIPRAPRVPVPPKPSRALKSRSRSMILNPIRREEDSTPLPEGSPTHIAIPASVARAQAAAAAKAAAKEAKEAAKAAAKAAKAGEKKGKGAKDAATTDAAATSTAEAVTPNADAAAATPVSTPSSGAQPAAGSTGPLGTASPSSTTSVGAPPSNGNPPSHSYSTLSFLSRFRTSLISSPTSLLTPTRGYATGKPPVSTPPASPATGAGKGQQAPVADEDGEDNEDIGLREDDENDNEFDEDDERINEDEDEDGDEDKDEDEDEDGDEDEDKDEDEDEDEDKDEDEDEDGDEDEDDDKYFAEEFEGRDELDEFDEGKFVANARNSGRNNALADELAEDDDIPNDELDEELGLDEDEADELSNVQKMVGAGAVGLGAAAMGAAASRLASPSAQANVAPESAAPPHTPAAVKETKKETAPAPAAAVPKKRGRKPKAQKEEEEEEEDEESGAEEKPKPKGRGRGKK